eukprot:gb/GECG01016524.1/.p1 GENE.gb/GECG01016524.1/~~gb/GECG01016524.1/.p1  ORF type:complete len:109 (+),score=17.02 gb/GECG01016524.1/:1-327(+)
MVLPFYMKRALTLRVMAYLDLFVFFFLVIQDVQAMFDPSKKKKKKKANRKELAEGLVPEQGFSSVPVEFAPDVDDGEEEPTYEEVRGLYSLYPVSCVCGELQSMVCRC